jgi:hypothetical protein
VLPSLEVQIQIAVAAALSLAPPRIRHARLAHTAEAWDHCSPIRPFQKLSLDRVQQFVGSTAGELVKPPRECSGLDELHNVTVSQCGTKRQVVVSQPVVAYSQFQQESVPFPMVKRTGQLLTRPRCMRELDIERVGRIHGCVIRYWWLVLPGGGGTASDSLGVDVLE